MKAQLNEVQKLQKVAGVLKEDIQEDSSINEKGNLKFSSKGKAAMTGTPLSGGVDSNGQEYDNYEVEFDVDTFRIIQGRNIIEISRKASKELAKEIRASFF